MPVVEFLTNVFVFWYFAFAAVILIVILRRSDEVRGFLRNDGDREGAIRPERAAAAGAPLLLLLLYTIHVVDGWQQAVDAKSLPDLPEAYLAILGSVNALYVARKMQR